MFEIFFFIFNSVPVKKISSLSGDSVPRLVYEEKEQECFAKDEQIQVSLESHSKRS